MQYVNSWPDSKADHENDCSRALDELFAGFDDTMAGFDDPNDPFPSSDSTCSSQSSDTAASWDSSNTSSTLASSVASSLGRGAKNFWRAHDAEVLNGPSDKSWWRRYPPRVRFSGETFDLEDGGSLPLQDLSLDRSYSTRSLDSSESCDTKTRMLPLVSIQLTLVYECKAFTYELEYALFRRWKHVALLIGAIETDGTKCVSMWDETEDMQVGAGDWDARAKPGWKVTLFCEDVYEDDCSEMGDYEDDDGYDMEKGYGEEWWFKRWKTRVERKKQEIKRKQRGWLIGAVAMVGIGVAFCAVTWFSLKEDRAIVIE